MQDMLNSMHDNECSSVRELFGGAIVCNIAESFEDISIYRTVSEHNHHLTFLNIFQVPDHQEVYVDKNSNTTVIVEILEREDICDDDAPEHFFKDLAQCNKVHCLLIKPPHVVIYHTN